MAEINWTVIIYLVVGLFALSGFFKGWWKEAVTTFFLVILVILLQLPGVATAVVDLINTGITFIWNIIPDSIKTFLQDVFANVFGISTASTDSPPLFDPGSATTWIIFLIAFMVIAILISRANLRRDWNKPGKYYVPTFAGSILGGLLGGLNGFILISLLRAYLTGTNLPTSSTASIGQLSATSNSVGMATVGFQATAVPQYSLLDNFGPWIVIVGGMVIFIAAINARYERKGLNFSPKKDKAPYGYTPYELMIKPAEKK
jgi:hypothetical protein